MDQNRKRLCRNWLMGWITLLIVSGCVSPHPPIAISGSPSPSISSTISPEPTKIFTPTVSIVAATLAPTSTTPSTSTSKIPAPSPTSGPTLAEADKEALVLDLLQNNAGCELPCWWGFTPGKTSWETARDFFLSYGEDFNSRLERQNIHINGFALKNYSFGIGVTLFEDKALIRVMKITSGTSPGIGELIYGDPFFQRAMQRYTLSQIFFLLGKPKQVLILVDDVKDEFTFLPDYHILLFYPDKGVLAEYEGRSDTFGDRLRLCPTITMISMWLWQPEENLILEDVYSLSAGYQPDDRKMTLGHYRSWEEISGQSIDDFVTTFKVQNTCFDTPAALWGRN